MPAKICRWHEGKQAALSLRFDDSHPTHVEKAVPMLNEHGLVGTFLINPGREGYQKHRAEWEGPILEQGHELGDHTMDHRGARSDRDAEEQIGKCAEHIWKLQPDKSRLLAFQRGGATVWLHRKPIEFFRAKYHLFRSGSANAMSCSEAYAPRFNFDAFRERLDRTLEDGDWFQCHFHGIDATHLHISTPLFRRMLGYVRDRKDDLWQAGMAAIYKYQQERDGALLLAHAAGPDELVLTLTCTTDPDLYDYPLTLEVALPPGVDRASASAADGTPLDLRIDSPGLARFDVPPVDGICTVRAKGLGAAWEQENGPELPVPDARPFLFFTANDLPALREKARCPGAEPMWARVQAEADRILNDPPSEETASTWERARTASNHIRVLGFVHALTGNAACAERAVPEIEAILAADSWNHPKHNGKADLVSAEIACSLGLAYDWMHAALPEALRTDMREAIVKRGLEPIVESTDKGEWFTHWYRGNWGAVIYGQAGVAALALLPDEPRALDWVRLCRRKTWGYTQSLGRDGSWGESVSYACYAWSNATLLMDALYNLTGGRVNLFDTPNLQHLPEWFIHLLVPDESGFVPFSNCGRGTRFRGQYLYRLARQYRDGHAQWIADRMAAPGGGADLFGFLWFDPNLAPQSPADLPGSIHFTHTDWAVLRSRWDDPNATLFALKGGQKDWDHYHHDMNHFALYAKGRPLLVDLYYPHQIWSCGTEAHNTVMVNGKDQRGIVRLQGCRGKRDHRGVLGGFIDTPWYTRLVGDASLAYEPDDVNSFVREVLYLRNTAPDAPPEYFVLFDDIDATAPVPVDWHLHTYGRLTVDGNRIAVVQDDAAADVTLLFPERFTHTLHEKDIEEDAGAPLPFEGAQTLTFLKLRPDEPAEHTRFVSVLAPRAAGDKPTHTVAALEGPNARGARVTAGAVEDRILFTLDAPEFEADGISGVGRSCLVRKTGGTLAAAALNDGQRLSADGVLLFETNGCGQAALTFEDRAVEAHLDLYSNTTLRLHAPRKPRQVLVNDEDHAFEYDPESRCVRVDQPRARRIRIVLE